MSMDSQERKSYKYIAACSSFVLACLLAITLQVFLFSPISPDPLQLPPPSLFLPNNHLQGVIKLGEGNLKQPEDVDVDKNGILYTATRDGWIKRMHTNGTWESWKMLHRDTLLGLTITSSGEVIVCDSQEGLLKVDEDGVTVLASHVNGAKIRFADDVVEASDGSFYFSVASTKFGLHEWYLDMLEAKPHGQLLKYDPLTKETSVALDHLCFTNGVAISKDQDYLVFCETWKYRCLKYWLKGENKGKVEVFIDNLHGGPDNIKLAPDGSFWIALLQLTSSGTEFVHKSRALKHMLATFQTLRKYATGLTSKAMVVNVGSDGKIIKMFDDDNGRVMSFVTSALEFEGNLYLGSLYTNFIGKLPLQASKLVYAKNINEP